MGEFRSPRLSSTIFMSFAFEQDSWPIGLRPCSPARLSQWGVGKQFSLREKMVRLRSPFQPSRACRGTRTVLKPIGHHSDSKAKDLRVQERDGVRGLSEHKTPPLAPFRKEKFAHDVNLMKFGRYDIMTALFKTEDAAGRILVQRGTKSHA